MYRAGTVCTQMIFFIVYMVNSDRFLVSRVGVLETVLIR